MSRSSNPTRDVWRAVVFSGAMLGVAACGGGSKKKTETPTQPVTTAPANTTMEEPAPVAPEPVVEEERPRAEEGAPTEGRGFIIA